MNLIIKPEDVKQNIIVTNITKEFEAHNYIKTTSFFKITLTHIPTGATSNSCGYSKNDVMVECLEKLNKEVLTLDFFSKIPSQNTSEEIFESKENIK